MATITIDGTDFWSYQTVAEVDAYAAGSVGDAATAWRALATDDDKGRCAVTATRLIDRQLWAGTKTDPDQPGAFPRTGLTYADGSAVDPDTVPPEVLSAHSELSMALAADTAVLTSATTASGTRRLKAGSVEIEYFKPLDPGGRFPLMVQELLGQWLGGQGSQALSEASGACLDTAFSPHGEFRLNRGF